MLKLSDGQFRRKFDSINFGVCGRCVLEAMSFDRGATKEGEKQYRRWKKMLAERTGDRQWLWLRRRRRRVHIAAAAAAAATAQDGAKW